eukprot:439616-Rhodomonas_salina.2
MQRTAGDAERRSCAEAARQRGNAGGRVDGAAQNVLVVPAGAAAGGAVERHLHQAHVAPARPPGLHQLPLHLHQVPRAGRPRRRRARHRRCAQHGAGQGRGPGLAPAVEGARGRRGQGRCSRPPGALLARVCLGSHRVLASAHTVCAMPGVPLHTVCGPWYTLWDVRRTCLWCTADPAAKASWEQQRISECGCLAEDACRAVHDAWNLAMEEDEAELVSGGGGGGVLESEWRRWAGPLGGGSVLAPPSLIPFCPLPLPLLLPLPAHHPSPPPHPPPPLCVGSVHVRGARAFQVYRPATVLVLVVVLILERT